jgi:hypothetical protein
MKKLILIALLVCTTAFAAAKIQDADVKTTAKIQFLKLADLTSGNILVGSAGNVPTSVAVSGEATISNAGAVTISNAAVIGKVLTGYTSGAGTVSATDTILQAIQKLNGNAAASTAITSLTGDVTGTGPGATATTLATVNGNVGSFTYGSFTVNAKGLITAASSGTAPVTSVGGTAPVVSSGGTTPTISMAAATGSVDGYLTAANFTTFNNKQAGPLTGDVTTSGAAATIANNAVTNAKAAQMAAHTFKGNNTGSTANASDLTAIQLSNELIIASQALTTCSTARTIDWATGNNFTVTLTNGNACAFTFSNAVSGQTITLDIYQPSSGGGTATATWATTTLWAGGTAPTISVGNSKTDTCTFKYNGTDYRGSCVQNLF